MLEHDLSLQFITGAVVGVELAFKEDLSDIPFALFGICIDLLIVRLVYTVSKRPAA